MDNLPGGTPAIWQEEGIIHSFDVDFRKRATAEALCRTFLEAAWNHAERLGFGYAALAQQHQFWVLARLLIEFNGLPQWGERFTLNTWPRGVSGLFALRDFEFLNSENQAVVAGTSSWLILDMATHRPQRLDRVQTIFPTATRAAAIGREAAKVTPGKTPEPSLAATVAFSHIDVNDHVNSARYLGWLMDSYPQDFHRNHSVRSIELNYTGQARWADSISVLTSPVEPLSFTHQVVRSDRSELCRGVVKWVNDSPSGPATPDAPKS